MNAPTTDSATQTGLLRLGRANAALCEASRRLISNAPEGPGDCLPLLEEARHSLEAFLAEPVSVQPADRAPLCERALGLRESLRMFSAHVLQWRTYFDSLAAELLRGQVNYDPSSVTAFSNSELERSIVDL